MTILPNGGWAVLQHVIAGRGAWHGWEDAAGHVVDATDCFAARTKVIQECRERGLLTTNNMLTAFGREVVETMEAAHG